MFGGLPSIDKLLTGLDRYDWMPGVMNTKQDDINFLITTFYFFNSHVWTLQYNLSFTMNYICVLLN